ncbi:MAG TPA: OBAP family protein [Rhodospirillales bacterium]|nr:OBAP family protein [Rhodospirillales bacterium]
MSTLKRMPGWPVALSVALMGFIVAACTGTGESGQSMAPAGEAKAPGTRALEAGAVAMQRDAPPDALDVYLVGFHALKADPHHQLEAHHFCRQVNEDFAQCALFDGNTAEANLNGIEYIISERLFERLPAAEKRYWHPHNGEILSGQLVAPGLPEAADHELMKAKMNSYGKTWHTWNTEKHDAKDVRSLPLGEPALAWSFNRFGEARQELIDERDRRMGVESEKLREARQDLLPLAHPQAGVNALKGKFPGPTRPIPGVIDKAAGKR